MPDTPPTLEILVFDDGKLVHTAESAGPIEIGRKRDKAERQFSSTRDGSLTRVVVAPAEDRDVSRHAARVEPLGGGRARVSNKHDANWVIIEGQAPLAAGKDVECPLPILLVFGKRAVRLQAPDVELRTLDAATVAPGLSRFASPFPGAPDSVAVVRWLREVMDVFHTAAKTDEFFARAERAVIDVAGMERGSVFLRDEAGAWAPAGATPVGWKPSETILGRVVRNKTTVWALPVLSDSVHHLVGVVAAPILNKAGKIVGVLYGERSTGNRPVSELESHLAELIAGAVAAGLARQDQEKEAMTHRANFEQFFTPELARHLETDPDMLNGREVTITLLFADVRGYSAVSEHLDGSVCAEWMCWRCSAIACKRKRACCSSTSAMR